jgi:hypothetical protein
MNAEVAMQYNAAKVRNVLVWIAVLNDILSLNQLWPIFYLAERRHLASFGEWMFGDIFVAMKQGPVPLRTFTELMVGAGRSTCAGASSWLDNWLRRMASQQNLEPAISIGENERECLKWASKEAKRLGFEALRQLACGRAWQRAGPDGELDPLEVALEGGAGAATLDRILRWKEGG